MQHPDLLEFAPPSPKETLLQEARKDFAQFYRKATADDAVVMDALVVAEVELQAVELRERIRLCSTFVGLTDVEKMEIERLPWVLLTGLAILSLFIADEAARVFFLAIAAAVVLWASAGRILMAYTWRSGDHRDD